MAGWIGETVDTLDQTVDRAEQMVDLARSSGAGFTCRQVMFRPALQPARKVLSRARLAGQQL
jgi:hypothetical protein